MFDVITIGSATRDVFISSKDFDVVKDGKFSTGQALALGLGSKFSIDKIVIGSGGGGTNSAVTFARQGFKTACIGVVGKDLNGDGILAELNKEGIDTSYFQRHDDDMTAYSVILVDKSGERSILSYKGEGQHFSNSKIPFDKMESKWCYVNSLGGHFEILDSIVKWAVDKGVKLATNPGGKELEMGFEKIGPMLKHFDIVSMNQEEAAGLFGVDYNNEEEVFKKADEAIGGIFIMSKGPAGVAVSDGKSIYRAGVPDSPIVERTGAGDAFSSGFVCEYIRSGDITKAIQFGTANASSVVTQFGSKAGILKKDDWGPWPLVEVNVSNI